MKMHYKNFAAVLGVVIAGTAWGVPPRVVGPGRATTGPVLRPALPAAGTAAAGAGMQPVLPPARTGGVSTNDRYVAAADLPPEVPPQPNGKPWMVLETEHFKVFHDQEMFAKDVGRLGEAFYDYISADMPGMVDRLGERKSIVCIFRKPEDWAAYRATKAGIGVAEWSASYVLGNAMYLQATGDHKDERMGTLAHEMTHLVFNRFLAVRLPLWLNEGLAEYYGLFGYRQVRGMGVSKKGAFRTLKQTYPLALLLPAPAYPADPRLVHLFYETGKYVVGFLTQRQDGEPWKAAWRDIMAGRPATEAILDAFGFADVAEMEREFQKFCH